ncbi:MAG: hypothetical protein M0R33_08965 [Methylomonas sp.]|jgi:hypothetical protein|uniref:hypothetical protein n=1 Tax=Methylomonas sp. TaxID=418 RepID=UPI0025DEE207|nr:hypothetical protein [Methylomonas sp.]MCK9606565.1 hypothetical protein [Methylomonas sp.]
MRASVYSFIAVGILGFSNLASASIWEPTANVVNFFSFPAFAAGPVAWSPTSTLGIFEDTETAFTTTPIAQFSSGANIAFSQIQGSQDWSIRVDSLVNGATVSSTGTLADSSRFQVAWLSSEGTASEKWVVQTGSTSNPWTPNFWQLLFTDTSLVSNNVSIAYATNIKPYQAGPVSNTPVPLPPAALSFLTGIVGFLTLRKRRTA